MRAALAKVPIMDDSGLRERIEELVAEERRLLEESVGQGPDEERHRRLQELKVSLDQCWDLLRQREAHEEFHLDPENTSVRDEGTVEGYEQ